VKDVVLINPPYQKAAWDRTYTPLGLPYIASNLEAAGYGVRIVDSDKEGLDVDEVVSIVAAEKPKVVGLTVLTHTLPKVYRIINGIKSMDCGIVVGGAHITADPEMVKSLGVDYGLRGEAEYSFVKIVDYITGKNNSTEDVEGLVLNTDAGLEIKSPCFIEDVDALPKPARHLIGMNGSYRYNFVFTSRGCPYDCIYCAEQCKKVRYRSPEKVVEEIEELALKYGVREFDFADSVFTISRSHVLEICKLLREKKLGVRWNCITRADLVDMELLKVMKRSGCNFISFGVESGVEKVRFSGGKIISDEKLREVFSQCRELGLRTRASMLFGTPGETIQDMRKSIEFARELRPDYALFNVAQLLPGTRLFKQALSEGIVDENIWRDYMQGRISSLDYLPEGVTLEDVYRINLEAFNRFYLDGDYMKRKVMSVSSFAELKEMLFILLAKANIIPVGGVVEDSMHKCIE